MTTLAKFGRMTASYHTMKTISSMGRVSDLLHVYTFNGGKHGEHSITVNRQLHDEFGMIGRAREHWMGYITQSTNG